jgi:hypothetical protein
MTRDEGIKNDCIYRLIVSIGKSTIRRSFWNPVELELPKSCRRCHVVFPVKNILIKGPNRDLRPGLLIVYRRTFSALPKSAAQNTKVDLKFPTSARACCRKQKSSTSSRCPSTIRTLIPRSSRALT